MKTNYLSMFLIIISFLTISLSQAQDVKNSFWTDISSKSFLRNNLVHRSSQPAEFRLYKLNIESLKNSLTQAPNRNSARGISNTIVEFPNSDGELTKFKVFESPIIHPDLSVKYPMIKTYAAQGIDDPTATMRFSITQFGLHVMILSGKRNAVYIDPYNKDRTHYMVYDRTALAAKDDLTDFECLTDEGYHFDINRNTETNHNDTDDQKLRTYRLALSCNAEYGNIFAGTGTDAEKIENIQAQMVITLNRVNEIYERDLAISLELIPNNDLLIYYGDVNTDPWDNEWNSTTQNTIDNTIGNDNYDIGHNFNTSGGGNAGCIACVCLTGQKGSGYTGRSDPTGDPFDIDYVAHEMGHQFGGYHTMNTCSRSGNGMTEVEPASGSSIMGYAGICDTNVQMNSDAHFNYVNIRDISANIQAGGNSTCGTITNLLNNPPTADAGSNYTIPHGTAFILEGSAIDADGIASLTYNWSQNDTERAPTNDSPQSTWDVGPLYRAKLPITSPKRYMPQFSDVLAGNLTPTWEVTPSVSRNMEFSFLVRDNDVAGGQTATDLMSITVDGNSGPFLVTSQASPESWDAGTNQTITWDVAGTDITPVNTSSIDIFITPDNGATFIEVASGIPNTGLYAITVPTGITTTAGRILLKASNSIYYAINSSNISIKETNFILNFDNTNQNICPYSDAIYNFMYTTFNNFSETTVFSATGNPQGSIISFNPSGATVSGTQVTLTISNLTDEMYGEYTIDVIASSDANTKNYTVTLNVPEKSLEIFPNPVSKELYIRSLGAIHLQVYTILGELVLDTSLDTESNQIDFSKYSQGVYFVQIEFISACQQTIKTYKIIKQ